MLFRKQTSLLANRAEGVKALLTKRRSTQGEALLSNDFISRLPSFQARCSIVSVDVAGRDWWGRVQV